jgi:hypothetical protein
MSNVQKIEAAIKAYCDASHANRASGSATRNPDVDERKNDLIGVLKALGFTPKFKGYSVCGYESKKYGNVEFLDSTEYAFFTPAAKIAEKKRTDAKWREWVRG